MRSPPTNRTWFGSPLGVASGDRLAAAASSCGQGGRIAANEILLKTAGLPNIIRDGNTPMLGSIIQAGKSQGMQAMDDVLFAFAKEGKVSAHDAYMKATDKSRFAPLLEAEGVEAPIAG